MEWGDVELEQAFSGGVWPRYSTCQSTSLGETQRGFLGVRTPAQGRDSWQECDNF